MLAYATSSAYQAELVEVSHPTGLREESTRSTRVEERDGEAAAARAAAVRAPPTTHCCTASPRKGLLPRTAWKSPQQMSRSMVMPCLASSAFSVA